MPAEERPEGGKASPRRQAPVAEREPLTIVVIETPPAEQIAAAPTTIETRVRARTEFGVPTEVPRRRWPFALLVAAAAILLLSTYRTVFAPLVLRFEHGIQRRVVGERSYDPPRDPKTKWPQS
jgi:hypothetical protein